MLEELQRLQLREQELTTEISKLHGFGQLNLAKKVHKELLHIQTLIKEHESKQLEI